MGKLQSTDLNVAPYYDDYEPDKNYHRILYRPSRTAQARELNQTQTILQDQIARFGNHIFENGSIVQSGGITVNTSQQYIGVNVPVGTNLKELSKLPFENYILIDESNNLQSVVKRVKTYNGMVLLLLDYINSGDSGKDKEYTVGNNLVLVEKDDLNTVKLTVEVLTTGMLIWANSLEGLYFINGHFVKSYDDDIIVTMDTGNPITTKIGFNINEQIITELEDETLLSNALGEPNFKSSGAARLKIDLDLTTSNTDDDNFVEIVSIKDGIIESLIKNTNYSAIESEMARRMYETNGNFEVKPFQIILKNHLKESTNDNDGVYLESQGGDKNKLVAELRSGIGYVGGHRIENTGTKSFEIDKALDTVVDTNITISSSYGSYILMDKPTSIPRISLGNTINFKDEDGAVIGTALVKSLRNDGDEKIRMYITNLKLTGDITNIKTIDDDNNFKYTLTGKLYIFETNIDNLLYKLPRNHTKNISSLSFIFNKTYHIKLDQNGKFTLSTQGDDLFQSVNDNDFIVYTNDEDGEFVSNTDAKLVVGGQPFGKTLSLDLGDEYTTKDIIISTKQTRSRGNLKVKTIQTKTKDYAPSNASSIKLDHFDVFEIVSVIDKSNPSDPVDVTSRFVLNTNQTEVAYMTSSIRYVGGSIPYSTIEVVYNYFEHSAGDYSSISSYGDLETHLIPKPFINGNEVNLANYIDFRPTIDENGNVVGGISDEVISPSGRIKFDMETYLPRIDLLYVDSDGNYIINKGISSNKPTANYDMPLNAAMALYEIGLSPNTIDFNDVDLGKVSNRRYRMMDIAKLDDRISNLEYYTSMNLIYRSNDMEIIDVDTGNNRFKNGIFADGFTDDRAIDFSNPDSMSYVDSKRGLLMPRFITNSVDFEIGNMKNVTIHNGIAYKSGKEVLLTKQGFKTKTSNINPYAVFMWYGEVKLTPSSDIWTETTYSDTRYTESKGESVVNNRVHHMGHPDYYDVLGERGDIVQKAKYTGILPNDFIETIDTRKKVDGNLDLSEGGNWHRDQGNELYYLYSETKSNTETRYRTETRDILVRRENIPYMRKRDINFKAEGLKPNTVVFPFFDNVNVSEETKPKGGNYGDELRSDDSGIVEGTFKIPNSKDKRFKTGTVLFKLSDSDEGSIYEGKFTTSSESKFTSTGTLNVRRKVVETVAYEVVNKVQIDYHAWKQVDPIAQTFIIQGEYGRFISKIGIHFASKSDTIPVTLQIRDVENGIPTLNVLSGGVVTLYPEDVEVSDDGSKITYFKLDRPLYIPPQKEQAIVLLSNSVEYNVFIAEMGGKDLLDGKYVSEQPHVGVFFQSSNGSTWTPNQTQDLTFEIHAMEFDTGESYIEFKNKLIEDSPMATDCISVVNGDDTATMLLEMHGFTIGDRFKLNNIKGFSDFGLDDGDINKEFRVSEVIDISTIKFKLDVEPTRTGSFGGYDGLITGNTIFSFMDVLTASDVFQNNRLEFKLSHKRFDNKSMTNFKEFSPDYRVLLENTGFIKDVGDVIIRVHLHSTDINTSPIISTNNVSGLTTTHVINNDMEAPMFAYVTKGIFTDLPSTSTTFFATMYLPTGSATKSYIKPITSDTTDEGDWIEIKDSYFVGSNDGSLFEYKFNYESDKPYTGYKLKTVFIGDSITRTPFMRDIRGISLA